jgi:hypothetical protein
MTKKFLAAVLLFAGCSTAPTVPTTGGIHYDAPAQIIVNPGNGRAIACYGVVTIEQIEPGTYDIYWYDRDHKLHVVRGVHDVEVTYPPPGDKTCGKDEQ